MFTMFHHVLWALSSTSSPAFSMLTARSRGFSEASSEASLTPILGLHVADGHGREVIAQIQRPPTQDLPPTAPKWRHLLVHDLVRVRRKPRPEPKASTVAPNPTETLKASEKPPKNIEKPIKTYRKRPKTLKTRHFSSAPRRTPSSGTAPRCPARAPTPGSSPPRHPRRTRSCARALQNHGTPSKTIEKPNKNPRKSKKNHENVVKTNRKSNENHRKPSKTMQNPSKIHQNSPYSP